MIFSRYVLTLLVDVRADDPEHAMEHFNQGLRRVLAADKKTIDRHRKTKRRHIRHVRT
jgi:hypothetical protein